MKTKLFAWVGLGLSMALLAGCANVKIAQDVKYIGFEDTKGETRNIGQIEGKSCTWSLFGWEVGDAPTVKQAFQSAAEQTVEKLPLKTEKKAGFEGNLKGVGQVAVDRSGFNFWIVGRRCWVVTGVGYK